MGAGAKAAAEPMRAAMMADFMLDVGEVEIMRRAIFCCPMAFCFQSILTINQDYLISIRPAYHVKIVCIYLATFGFASAVTYIYFV